MFEVGILSVIGMAGVYWTALWWMGRRDDVLYGGFVASGADAVTSQPDRPRPWAPAALRRPLASPETSSPIAAPPSGGLPVEASHIRHALPPAFAPEQFAPSAPQRTHDPGRSQVLSSLLETIKRDLDDAARH